MRKKKSHRPKRQTAQERQEWIRAFQQSGLSRAAFARKHSLNYSTFSLWLKQKAPDRAKGVTDRSWIELPVSGKPISVSPTPSYRFKLPGDLCLEVDRGFESQEVQALLSIARESCSR